MSSEVLDTTNVENMSNNSHMTLKHLYISFNTVKIITTVNII